MSMIAFHGKKSVKAKYLKRIRLHAAQDQIVKGQYWEEGKGCAVGCTIHSGDHSAYESELGIPEVLARLEDGIFEALPNELAMTWPDRFLSSIPIGADLSMVWPKFAHWLLGEVRAVTKSKRSLQAVIAVQGLYGRWIGGYKPQDEEWTFAAYAYAYAYADADATYAAYAAYASYAYADAAAAAAAYAAYAAAAYADGKTQARIRQSEKLLELLAN